MIERLRTLERGCIRAECLPPGIDGRTLDPHEHNFEIVGRVIDSSKQQLYSSMVSRFMRTEGDGQD